MATADIDVTGQAPGTAAADIGVTGMGVMGRNLARNLARHGYRVALHNRTWARTQEVVAEHGSEGTFVPARSVAEFCAALSTPRIAVVMVPAGPATDQVIEELAEVLQPGDVVVDAGNAHYTDTRRREAALRERGLEFVGCGVSGGEEGALLGPSIMPGGSAASYERLGPILESIAARVEGVPCCTHVGPDGAGHFVKMVHNGIEYADMQLIGEAYDLLRHAVGAEPAELAGVFAEWNRGELSSYLIEITAEVLGHVDGATGRAFVDVVEDRAGQKGTGRWTVQSALDLGVPVTGIAEATFARALSSSVPQREAGARLPAGAEPWAPVDRAAFVEDVRLALLASKVVAYSQGFEQIAAASAEFDWGVDAGAMARIWRGGCIIRAAFLDRITEAYARASDGAGSGAATSDAAEAGSGGAGVALLLAEPYFAEVMARALPSWRRVVAGAALAGVPVPAFASSLAYYDAVRADRLPAALVQAQRDFFGAHTYHRVDREGTFHTLWAADRSEVREA